MIFFWPFDPTSIFSTSGFIIAKGGHSWVIWNLSFELLFSSYWFLISRRFLWFKKFSLSFWASSGFYRINIYALSYIIRNFIQSSCTIKELDLPLNGSIQDIDFESMHLVVLETVCHGYNWNNTDNRLEILEDREVRGIGVLRVSEKVQHQMHPCVVNLIQLLALLEVIKFCLLLNFFNSFMIVRQLYD